MGAEIRLEIVPVLWALSQNLDTRVYQNKMVPKIAEAIVDEKRGRQRSLRQALSAPIP